MADWPVRARRPILICGAVRQALGEQKVELTEDEHLADVPAIGALFLGPMRDALEHLLVGDDASVCPRSPPSTFDVLEH